MKRRSFLKAISSLPLLGILQPSRLWAAGKNGGVLQIAFGSCADQTYEQPIWDVIGAQKPDLFIFLGDNIYADTEDMNVMADRYDFMAQMPHYKKFRSQIPIIATWDDHDYGINDGGAEYPQKQRSKELMLDFFREPLSSPRRKREGIYTSYFVGDKKQLQIILLDLRWFRSPLVGDGEGFKSNPDPAATMLGEEQWAWLEAQLRLPAEFRLLVSSTQLAAPDHQWEKWANFPLEKARLMKMLDDLQIRNLAVLSGDMHYGELSKETTPGGFEIVEMTSSGLNYFESSHGIPNSNRVEVFDQDCNYGWVSIDTNAKPLKVRLEVRNSKGQTVLQQDCKAN